ncbi:serine O-acetyltransferase [Chitinophaga nivalis]|uniref:Serine acetyltransferase n=1 Tax=Chitinophaga nivalis TaxID=2991709 RepID=A0ABT3IP25_9BACT|nr:serine acetyltransferase [Chitinophaga nivalis]MCW3464663.1 serine acetyltransferase [Chitinophaga nivalis]MCW3485646.1 serine acetyltransferase [Chitinophaga nivalis]
MKSWDFIKSDLHRYHGRTDRGSLLRSFWLIEGFRYMFFLRLCAGANRFSRVFYRVLLRHYSYKYGFQIPFTTRIGKGFYIGHFGNIVINGNARIGDNVNISPGVVIGQVSRGRTQGVPTIGNRVWIGSNAIIVGNINIGDDVLIAPGAYVTTDVPAGSLVKGNPAVITVGKGVEGYICNAS